MPPVRRTSTLFVALASLVACSRGSTSEEPPPQQEPDAPTGGLVDPFASQPDESEGLTNVSASLDELLEHGTLATACDQYRNGQTDRATMLRCGKWKFFYDPFGTFGIPAVLVKFMAKNFPDELGVGFSKVGMVPDPTSTDSLPLGIAPSAPSGGNPTLAFTCASCHFGRLPDGRYAVGAPNHNYAYGRHILSIVLAPSVGLGLSQASSHDPAAIAAVQPILDRLAANSTLKNQLLTTLIPLAGSSMAGMDRPTEHAYATWPDGTMDFMIAPLPVDDHAHTVSAILPLWGIPRQAELSSAGMEHAFLSWSGNAHSLDEFVRGFAILGGTGAPSDAEIRPLVEYVYSLRAPSNPTPPDAAQVAAGKQWFETRCAGCHDGPRGSGRHAYSFDEVGTDPALAEWADPMRSGNACCGLPVAPGSLTHGVKSPRLVGMWALGRFLHNGTVTSLDQLLCLAPRPPTGVEPLRSDGHDYGCDLAESDRRALVAFMLAH